MPKNLKAPVTQSFSIRLLALAIVAGCGDSSSSLRDAADSVRKAIGRNAPNPSAISGLAADELEKLYRVEYKVVRLETFESQPALEAALTALGKDRWECTTVVERADGPALICRRLPLSVLKAVWSWLF